MSDLSGAIDIEYRARFKFLIALQTFGRIIATFTTSLHTCQYVNDSFIIPQGNFLAKSRVSVAVLPVWQSVSGLRCVPVRKSDQFGQTSAIL